MPVTLTVTDDANGVLSAGFGPPSVQVDNDQIFALEQVGFSDPTPYTGNVKLRGLGPHTLTVVCQDDAGTWVPFRDKARNPALVSPPSTTITVRESGVRAITEADYLIDLIDFAGLRLTTEQGVAVTPTALEVALHQPFGQLIGAGGKPRPLAPATEPINAVRGIVEVLRSYLTPTPLAHWPLDEGSGTLARDDTNRGADGSLVKATWGPGPPGRDAAVIFDGAQSYVSVPSTTEIDITTGALTIAGWINPTAAGGGGTGGMIVELDGWFGLARMPAAANPAQLTLQVISTNAGGAPVLDTGVAVPQGNWTHVAVSYDGAYLRTYLNGALAASRAETASIKLPSAAQLRIGARASANQLFFQGSIADVGVYDRALSDYVIALLAGGTPALAAEWIDDALPAGVTTNQPDSEGWNWNTAPPVGPASGTKCHLSPETAGLHQHYFQGLQDGWRVERGDTLHTYVYLDPHNPPTQIMLQWDAGPAGDGWQHRAFWGPDEQLWGVGQPQWGTSGTGSRRYMGPLPQLGAWQRLEVPAALVELEGETVHGMAFTLFDGQAWWDLSGITIMPRESMGLAPAALAQTGYAAVAYEALLRNLGTSGEELRAARGAPDRIRRALAARLAITLPATRPDQLDQLLVPADLVTEAQLERLFGLKRTDTDPLVTSGAVPQLLTWQTVSLRDQWASEDHPNGQAAPTTYRHPVVDPDIVTDDDLVEPLSSNPALATLRARQAWISSKVDALQAARKASPADAAAGFQALLAYVGARGGSIDLEGLGTQLDAGHDIAALLAAVPIDFPAFARLRTLAGLAAPSGATLTSEEWDDACGILSRVLKTRRFVLADPDVSGSVSWLEEEQRAGLVLDPNLFQASPASPTLLAWRASWPTRIAWQDRLVGRADQLANLTAGLSAAATAAEQAALPLLRDAALALAAPSPTVAPEPVRPDAADALSARLCVDLKSSPQLTTTRLDQAIEAIQGLLGSIDAGGELTAIGLAWHLLPGFTADTFITEAAWMGEYSAWAAAMSVFFFPENHLLPSLRAVPTRASHTSDAFVTLVGNTTNPQLPAMDAQRARDLATGYWAGAGTPVPSPIPAELQGVLAPAPQTAGGPTYPYTEEHLSAQTLQALSLAQANYLRNTGTGFPDGWFREVFYDLPMQLALALAQNGQWRNALDWLRIVYDHTQPPGQREIFAGFSKEPADTSPTRDENWLTNLDPHAFALSRQNHTYKRFTLQTLAEILCDWADAEFSADSAESRARARSRYAQAQDVLAAPELAHTDTIPPDNPELTALRARAQSGLAKLRAGLNIAGMIRPLAGIADVSAGGVAIPQATNYRSATLLARAQQLCQSAAQIEAGYLASLEKADAEKYQQMLAQLDLTIAAARVNIAAEQVSIANEQVGLAQQQIDRANVQVDRYQSWISNGPNFHEQQQLNDLQDQKTFRGWAAQAEAASSIFGGIANAVGSFPFSAASVASGVAGGASSELSYQADRAGINAQIAGIKASLDREIDQWTLSRDLANADVTIGVQQKLIAQGQAQVAVGEAQLAVVVQNNAQSKLNFLQTKFTNAQLYVWMSGVLGGVYRYLLQQGASIARLAEQQLAFERQAKAPGYVKADYWTALAGSGMPASGTGGLTGSARLLEDITQLQEYALDTNQRKVQITQGFSLATIAPVAFQQFRVTGRLAFALPLDGYGTPGMYLATVRQARVSVTALIPPDQGIRATLSGGGSSRIVVKDGYTFRTVTLARAPETVVLASPVQASGVFQVDLTPDILLPFEGCGLDVPFELQLPRAINQFDYRTIVDVEVTIDYTALYSPDYAAKVIRDLPSIAHNSLPLSLRDDAEGWYRLLAQAQAAKTAANPPADLVAQWTVTAGDLPANVSAPALREIALLVARRGDTPTSFAIDYLQLNGQPAYDPANPSTPAVTVGDLVSTRNGSGASWNKLLSPAPVSPIGTWTLGLHADPATIAAFAGADVDDIMLVLSYDATLPGWTT